MIEEPARPIYRICWSDGAELLKADSLRREGIRQVLRGATLVIGRPREVVLRRVPHQIPVEEVADGFRWSRPR